MVSAPTPQNSAGTGGGTDPDPDPDPDPTTVTIAEIQGTGSATPLNGQKVTTDGVVTAVYPTGGFNGFYMQTPGTGGEIGDASHGIFVYTASAPTVEVGQYISVTGTAGEYYTLTQLSSPTITVLDEAFEAPTPAVVTPVDLTTDAQRERLEGMLLDVAEVQFTVTDTYETNRYGSVALAMDDAPLPTATDIYHPVHEKALHDALVAENLQKMITLDDGTSRDYTSFSNNNHQLPLPYISITDPVRVGADAQINEPVILDYRFQWNLQPTVPVTGENDDFVAFENTRVADAPVVGGDVTIATFNVLNYFTTLGTDLVGCTSYNDRQGNPITVRGGCQARGAFNAENLARQEGKIVSAIQELDASIVGIQEIEMSAAFGKNRDAALADLVAALNADAGFDKWGYAASPAQLPTNEDVIRLAFIYQVDEVAPTEDSKILIGSAAFGNAREPLGQAWQALDAAGEPVGEEFATINNHFKSKGSGTDDGTGQGNANPDRIAQAQALVAFADAEYGDMPVFLVGDFNSYSAEDPLRVLEAAGYTNLLRAQSALHDTHFYTYTFGKRVGSLDHIFASAEGSEWVTDAAVWNINSVEAIALEYSRYNYNVADLFEENSPFRSSDHDPIVVGLDIPGVNDVVVVSPEAPTFEDNVITIPEVEGVEYLIGDAVVEAGTVAITEDTTVTARAIEGYVLADDAVTEWTFEYVAPLVEVTPVAPAFEDNVITIPEVEGVEYLIGGAVVEAGTVAITEDTTVTARAAEGYVLADDAVTEWTFEYVAPLVEVTPVAPAFEDNVIVIPEVEGVEYLIGGAVVEAGTVAITEDTTVTARAAEGYVLADDAVTEWTFEYVAPLVEVTPVAPAFEDNVIVIPEVEGVEYLIGGAVVEAGTVAITEDTTVTARAAEGYVLADDAVTEWTFEYVAPLVEVTPVAPAFEDNVITIPEVEGVEYLIGGAVVEAGTVAITEDTTVTARAAEGYVLADDAVTEWTFEYVAPLVEVTPVAPAFEDNVITIPEVEGVEYLIGGAVVEAGTVAITEDTTVTARAAEGYVLADDAVTEWTFEYVAPQPAPAPRGNVFFIANDWTSHYAELVFSFGRRGDEVFAGDWDGDGKDTLAVRRGNTFYGNNELVGGNAEVSFNYGRVGDEVLVGDWNGDGKDTFGVRRGNTFYLNSELVGGNAEIQFDYGRAGDQVFAGDWDNDGVDTLMVRRGTTFYVNNELVGGHAEMSFVYGRAGDDVYVGDFDGDGYDTIAVRRGNVFYVNNELEGGHADHEIAYGRAGDKVLIGDWDGDGIDTPAVNRIV
ncbi:ExeM/NucH family extracellular endonuclease [Flaviflexus salsibiostraticola]|uniref:ExeM/NucH family extracellular endonuclease n=1 Tax=Flaviflexus salsibiostraticola TaxID=1282737 RepID=UPI001FE54B75|nr:ExeM/NucH family extracellular endonuclease [Flaviflexus salsibiostraticola]